MATHETIITRPSEWGDIRVANSGWLFNLAEGIEPLITDDSVRTVRIDMHGARFIAMFEWTSACALLLRLLEERPQISELNLDFTENGNIQLVPAQTIIDSRPRLSAAAADSERIYRAIGFLESLGTLELLNAPTHSTRVFYGNVEMRDVRTYSLFYGGANADTVVNGLHRILTPENCTQFLNAESIIGWRRSMAARFESSPLFASDEVWRVFSHELSVNIWEHAGATGAVAARVLEPRDGRPRGWWKETFPSVVVNALKDSTGPILELCATDAGSGLVDTLARSYGEAAGGDGTAEDVIAFAFDDIGTSKDKEVSWTTERHALGRVLRLVQKYGGAMLMRTADLDTIYVHRSDGQKIHRSGYGFSPAKADHHGPVRGTHIQLLIPLYPSTTKGVSPRPRLKAALPQNFTVESQHAIGHMVPLREYFLSYSRPLTAHDQAGFRSACESVNRSLLTGFRPLNDPVVFDFTGLNWTPSEFETLLHYLEPVLQRRTSLLVELDPQLALEVEELESGGGASRLTHDAAPIALSSSGRVYGLLSERQYLETYNRIHSCVLGVDRTGKRHLFGVAGEAYRRAVMELLHTSQTLKQLQESHPELDAGLLAAILNTANPAFEVDRSGVWSTTWDEQQIEVQSSRALGVHFQHVADICGAWASARVNPKNSGIFQLPWEREWLKDFFEASRILTRERYADEIAQRLLARLTHALNMRGRHLADIGVLASLTSPGLQLAHALHRWWPISPRPSVVDLGYYIGLAEHAEVPVIPTTGEIMIVQDVLDTLRRTQRVVTRLVRQGHRVAATVAVVRLGDPGSSVGSTQIETAGEDTELGLAISLVHLVRPPKVTPITGDEEWAEQAYWIEPRTLQPFRFARLRYDTAVPQLHEPQRENSNVIDEGPGPCPIVAGHYAYGHRHFDVTVDVQTLLKGAHGERISSWIADVCEGRSRECEWEEPGSHDLMGDVTAVVMPLHSQIHYLWPRVQARLARRGRRQPFFVLDTTLFLRDEGAFQIPRQLSMLILDAVKAKLDPHHPTETSAGVRLLILDDAIASARTVETIIAALDGSVTLAYRQQGAADVQAQRPIFEWIRHFAILNKMTDHKDHFWNSLRTVGAPPTRFHFDHYARFNGMAVFNRDNCHACRSRAVASSLVEISNRYPGAEDVARWAEKYVEYQEPTAIDTEAVRHTSVRLPVPIRAITSGRAGSGLALWPPSHHADTAIWRFHELMEMAVPPSLLLRSLPDAPVGNPDVSSEYARYRAGVLSWCIRHWERTVAHAATDHLRKVIIRETMAGEMDVLPLFMLLANLAREPEVTTLIREAVDRLVETDVTVSALREDSDSPEPVPLNLLLRLEKAITVFMLARPRRELEREQAREDGTILRYVEEHVAANRSAVFTKNLLLRLLRPARAADPRWALMTVAETLYRGRDPQYDPVGWHLLLPRILADLYNHPNDEPTRRLALGSATLFRAALRDLEPYADLSRAGVTELDELLSLLIAGVGDSEGVVDDSTISNLSNAIDNDAEFNTIFSKVFHERVEDVVRTLKLAAHQRDLDLKIDIDEDTGAAKVLTHVDALRNALLNWLIEPTRSDRRYRARLRVSRDRSSTLTPTISFTMTTGFADFETASTNVLHGPNASIEHGKLTAFGGSISTPAKPSQEDERDGLTTTFTVTVMAGFTPRRRSSDENRVR